eukprot:TRINITY_DN779_c0_g1_i1.p1 TRINITY_DN779_c0_g1~~TRINITY_DN779_c0_g1_i1.p1  ORF type:complete len:431 (+),score=92.22 TRINITY_DN779_c0_g1_i1:255-1547(+)
MHGSEYGATASHVEEDGEGRGSSSRAVREEGGGFYAGSGGGRVEGPDTAHGHVSSAGSVQDTALDDGVSNRSGGVGSRNGSGGVGSTNEGSANGSAVVLSFAQVRRQRVRANWFRMCASLAVIVAWLTVGATAFFLIEGEYNGDERWTWPNSFYFSAVTLTTVGFGDFEPVTTLGRSVNVLFIVVGLGLVSVLLSAIARGLVSGFEQRIRQLLGTAHPSLGLIAGEGAAEGAAVGAGAEEGAALLQREAVVLANGMRRAREKVARSPIVTFLLEDAAYWIAVAGFLFLVVVGGIVFWSLERTDEWNIWYSMYFCIITLTTVGYGNIVPTTTAARLIMVFYSIVGLGVFAFLITETGMRLARRFTSKRAPNVAYTIDMEDLWQAIQKTEELLPKVRPNSRMHILVKSRLERALEQLAASTANSSHPSQVAA